MPADLSAIKKLEVPLIVQVASHGMSMREVTDLSPGAIIELPKNAEDELEILVQNKQIGVGTAVKVGENFGVRVTYVGDVRERIAALGGSSVSRGEVADLDAEALADQMLAGQ